MSIDVKLSKGDASKGMAETIRGPDLYLQDLSRQKYGERPVKEWQKQSVDPTFICRSLKAEILREMKLKLRYLTKSKSLEKTK